MESNVVGRRIYGCVQQSQRLGSAKPLLLQRHCHYVSLYKKSSQNVYQSQKWSQTQWADIHLAVFNRESKVDQGQQRHQLDRDVVITLAYARFLYIFTKVFLSLWEMELNVADMCCRENITMKTYVWKVICVYECVHECMYECTCMSIFIFCNCPHIYNIKL